MSVRTVLRVYGQVESSSPATLAALLAVLPDDAGGIEGKRLEIEHEGFYFDPDPFLEAAAVLLAPGEGGHLDLFDEDERSLTRIELAHGGHSAKTFRYDDILEHTKGEGNW
ncbi:hypothetical protein JCM15519_30850 [Fundidesulfovibrio butyratiphilus]